LPHQPSGVRGASLGLVAAPDTVTYPEVTLSMRPGDLALHHVNVIHRTGPNQTGDHRRNLGFAYHSARARRDDEANARYQQHLKQIKPE
jgi:ectoine hydroxylase-related dioxygenase (phytanoyl-CoA dioxygenase family)